MTTKQLEKTVNNYTELRLAFDESGGYYGLMTNEGKFLDGIVSLELTESAGSVPTVNVSIRLSK